ncbi:hypothetical protein MSAN_00836100 [Mycena sanguinolenta]|uniref:Uncharacterized protein n=1 Tax=Mycena sanguinolenta TaxID=230812 RepID=A0A8H7DD47_9AGAR|nr:hypothetical protein MSAN_00836100 [Mycena sanguinolenta]
MSLNDVVHAVTIFRAPSKENFEAQMKTLIDELVGLPRFQDSLLKLEMVLQNHQFDDHLESYVCPPPEPMVLLEIEAESAGHIAAFMSEVQAQNKIQGLASITFPVSVYKVFHRDSSVARADRVRIIWIHKAPQQMSNEEYAQKFGIFLKDYAAVPVVQKNLVGLEEWSTLEGVIHTFGDSPPPPACIGTTEYESWENVDNIRHEDPLKVVHDAKDDFALNAHACVFVADLVTELDRF